MNRHIAVIDVNIPKHITKSDVGLTVPREYIHLGDANVAQPKTQDKYEDEDRNRAQVAEELATYLWENYIEYERLLSIFAWYS